MNVRMAMCYHLLLAYIKYQTKFAHSITERSRMIKEILMEKTILIDILSLNIKKLKKIEFVDGFLIGGASLSFQEFEKIVDSDMLDE